MAAVAGPMAPQGVFTALDTFERSPATDHVNSSSTTDPLAALALVLGPACDVPTRNEDSEGSESSAVGEDADDTAVLTPPEPAVVHEPIAGPSTERFLYVAVRQGSSTGVFSSWSQAQRYISEHPSPIYKTFSTRLAAEAYVAGWDGAGRHSLPPSSPRALREHLAMTFPASVPLLPPSSVKRPSYHARLLNTLPALPSDSEWNINDSDQDDSDFSPNQGMRSQPHLGVPGSLRQARSTGSFRNSMVKASSPLRMVVDEPEEILSEEQVAGRGKRATSLMGLGGLLSPPASPKKETTPELGGEGRAKEAPARRATADGALTKTAGGRPRSLHRKSSLWGDSMVESKPGNSHSPGSPTDVPSNAPAFSRAGLKKKGVVMPVAAPQIKHSSSLTNLSLRRSRPSLQSSSSMSSLHSADGIAKPERASLLGRTRSIVSQDRLSTLAETSHRELELNEQGLLALGSLPLPKPAFMRQTSNSSISSLSSLGSGSNSPSSILEEEEPLEEEPLEMASNPTSPMHSPVIVQGDGLGSLSTCTRSDGDAEGSIDSSSTKSGLSGRQVKGGTKGGGMFKRFSKALKLK